MSLRKTTRHRYDFGPFRLDVVMRRLHNGTEIVPLTHKAFDLLLALVQNAGQIIEKEVLIERVWPDTVVEESNLTQHIHLLRKALGQGRGEPIYIETIPGRGYRFTAGVREIVDDRRSGEPENQSAISLSAIWPQSAITSLAVLPFRLLAAERHDQYLKLGLADALITKLSNVLQIVVRPTSAVLRYARSERDLLAVGRELQVDAILEGGIQRAGEKIRVTVQLVRVADGATLWADKFDEQFTEILAVEDVISEQAARALMLRLSGIEREKLTKRYTGNTAAYHLYLKGRYFWNKITEQGFLKGIEYFQQAVAVDPDYALAYVGLADSYLLLVDLGYRSSKEALPEARAAALTAIAIDESLAEAHTSLAHTRFYYDWDFAGAEQEFKRALDLNPNYATAHQWYGWYYHGIGAHSRAVAELERAQEIDPLSLIINTTLGISFLSERQYDQAIGYFQNVIDIDPHFALAHHCLGLTYAHQARLEEAVAELRQAIRLSGSSPLTSGALGYIHAICGNKAEARRVLDELRKQSKHRYVSPYHLARIYAGLGEKDSAFAWLEQACQARSHYLVWIKTDLLLDHLRPDPRFRELIQRVGFPDG
ncbi:MAG: TPR end-of-group domain-containing protein [Blastocatellia bacterium]